MQLILFNITVVRILNYNYCKIIDNDYLIFFSVNIDQPDNRKRQAAAKDEEVNSKQPKKATDDYHFDKFRKQFRK